jgi:hypothetical protein
MDGECGASSVPLGASWAYLYVEVPVDLDGVAEQADILREVGKLPHVAQLVQCGGFSCGHLHLHLLVGALPGGHGKERAEGDASG